MLKKHDLILSKHSCLLLWALCLIGSWAIFPYTYSLGLTSKSLSIFNLFIVGSIQALIFYGIICWISYKILPKTDLSPFIIDNYLQQIIYPGIISGTSLGLIIYLLENTVFQSSLLFGAHPPAWAGALASIYGGINEEVLLRLFSFTLIYFIFKKFFKFKNINRLYFLWTTNIIISIAFGIAHLPAIFTLIAPDFFEISRVLLINGIVGLVFGWLYWSRGIWTAILAHFITDLMIHVVLI